MQERSYFWPSYVDLMTSLFFVMLVMFAFYYIREQKRVSELKLIAKEYDKIRYLSKLLDPIRHDTQHFKYDAKYNRYLFTQDVKFNPNTHNLFNENDLKFGNQDPSQIREYLRESGKTLKKVVDNLHAKKDSLHGAKYMVVISGVASRTGEREHNYDLSYWRAKSLYEFWKREINFDLDAPKYHEVLELSIGGVGEGGVDRYAGANETKNQRIIIQIVPKPKFD